MKGRITVANGRTPRAAPRRRAAVMLLAVLLVALQLGALLHAAGHLRDGSHDGDSHAPAACILCLAYASAGALHVPGAAPAAPPAAPAVAGADTRPTEALRQVRRPARGGRDPPVQPV